MRQELRQVPEDILSRKERKIKQWEAEIRLLRVKRKKMLDAGIKQNAPRMVDNDHAIEDRRLKIQHANNPAFEDDDEESSDEDIAVLRRFRKRRTGKLSKATRSATVPARQVTPVERSALSDEPALALSGFSTRRAAPQLQRNTAVGPAAPVQNQPPLSDQQDGQKHLKVGGQASRPMPLARPPATLHHTPSLTREPAPPLPPVRPARSSSHESVQQF